MNFHNLKLMQRLKASGLHLMISAGIAAVAALLIFKVWYPEPLAQMQGVDALVILMVAVDVVLGPLLTLVVFAPGKKSLKLDLAVIAALQIAALLYGLHTIFAGRPALIVFNVDRFDVVAQADIDEASYAQSRREGKPALPLFGPRFVAAFAPDNVEQKNELTFSSIKGGADLPQLPHLQTSYDDGRNAIVKAMIPIEKLRTANSMTLIDWQLFLADYGLPESDLGFLPLIAKAHDGVVILSRRDASVVAMRIMTPAAP